MHAIFFFFWRFFAPQKGPCPAAQSNQHWFQVMSSSTVELEVECLVQWHLSQKTFSRVPLVLRKTQELMPSISTPLLPLISIWLRAQIRRRKHSTSIWMCVHELRICNLWLSGSVIASWLNRMRRTSLRNTQHVRDTVRKQSRMCP